MERMIEQAERKDKSRRPVLVVVMLGVLLLAIGAAWLVQRWSQQRVGSAVAILTDIRRQGLGSIWKQDFQIDWYLLGSADAPAGWRANIVGQTEKGFAGWMIQRVGRVISIEEWRLNNEATSGNYEGRVYGGQGIPGTEIFLSQGQVQVAQQATVLTPAGPQQALNEAASPAPQDYIPEGLLSLVIRQVALQKADAQFSMIFNEQAIEDKRVWFSPARMHWLGQAGKGAKTVDRVGMALGAGRQAQQSVYELDGHGRLVGFGAGQQHWRLSDESTVLRVDGRAEDILQKELPRTMFQRWQRLRLEPTAL